MNLARRIAPVALLLLPVAGCLSGCGALERTWHEKFDWKAEDYFDDLQVIALCEAIEANDLEEIDRLVAAGADVNAKGKGNMTPLLWAYPDNKLERFKRLLEHGADPNVIAQNVATGNESAIFNGTSVTHLASGTAFSGYFDAVFDNGGAPNVVSTAVLSFNWTPIFHVIRGAGDDRSRKVARLISLGADLDFVDGSEKTPAVAAVTWGQQFGLALEILEGGADFNLYYEPDSNRQLVHDVVYEGKNRSRFTPNQSHDYERLLEWLRSHGVDLDAVQADLDRWASVTGAKEHAEMRAREVAERRAREAQATQADGGQPDDKSSAKDE